MNVVVVDAGEPVGRLLVAGALRRGHVVTAFGRSRLPTGATGLESGASSADARLQAAGGDVLDPGAVIAALVDQQAVLFAVEPPGGRGRATRASEGMRHVVRAMTDLQVRRLVCLSIGGPGSERDGDSPGLLGRLLGTAPPKGALADLRQMEVTVRQSSLDWTIVRPARLVDDPAQHSWRAGPGYALPHGTKIARADVAEFMLDQLGDGANVGHAVAVAW